MVIPVIYVSYLVQLYSMGYMAGDLYLARFFSYLSFFSLMMQFLVTGENLLVLFVGWEGVGIASYLLINFWFTRLVANFAALKAFLMNRVGDYSLVQALQLLFRIYSDQSIDSLLSLALYLNGDLLFVVIILLVIGASAKSAQIGLHGWLPTAMEAPTPVSALIHAATMVTAGVYLLMRLSPQLEWTSSGLVLIVWLGGQSALFGAISGLLEYDIKKVIAYSTTSQLGYMVLACGLSEYSLALFHLINHAFFKALLFLSAGLVIHALIHQQDLRKMGSLVQFNPETYSLVLLGSLSLMAFPFLTGFYSKDLILEIAIIPRNATILIAFILVLIAAYLTASYSARLMIGCFLTIPHIHHTLFADTIYSFTMLVTVLLSIGASVFGYLVNQLFLFSSYQGALFVHPDNLILLDSLPYSVGFPLLTLLILLVLIPVSLPVAVSVSVPVSVSSNLYLYLYLTLNHFNLQNHWIIHNILSFALYLSRYWDRGLLEQIGPTSLFKLFHYYSFKLELLTITNRNQATWLLNNAL